MSINTYFDIVYVIALPSRVNYISTVLRKMGIHFTIIPAILGKNVDQKSLVNDNLLDTNHSFKNNNEICCSLSHLKTVDTFLNNTYYNTACIFEDDIVLDTNYQIKLANCMKDLPNDWEFFNMGRCWANCYNNQTFGSGTISITPHSLCSHSYAITRNGAKKIIRGAFPITKAVDMYYSEIDNLKFYSSSPRIFNQLKSITSLNNTSSLGNTDTCQECQLVTLDNYISPVVIIVIIVIIMGVVFYKKLS